MSENKIEKDDEVRFKNEYRKKGEEIGLIGILTVESIDNDNGVKFQEDKKPIVTIDIDWLELVKEEKN